MSLAVIMKRCASLEAPKSTTCYSVYTNYSSRSSLVLRLKQSTRPRASGCTRRGWRCRALNAGQQSAKISRHKLRARKRSPSLFGRIRAFPAAKESEHVSLFQAAYPREIGEMAFIAWDARERVRGPACGLAYVRACPCPSSCTRLECRLFGLRDGTGRASCDRR